MISKAFLYFYYIIFNISCLYIYVRLAITANHRSPVSLSLSRYGSVIKLTVSKLYNMYMSKIREYETQTSVDTKLCITRSPSVFKEREVVSSFLGTVLVL